MEKTTQYTEAYIRQQLATNEKWVRRALIRLYERQTLDERSTERTHNHNRRGFQPCDAKWFSRFAKYLLKYPTARLSEKQLAIVRKPWRDEPAICKYAGQLMQIMQEDAAKKAVTGMSAAGQNALRAEQVTVVTQPETNVCGHCGEERPGCRCEMKAQYAAQEAFDEMVGALSSMR